MCPVILSGGGGTRLWPLSRTDEPKQFQALISDRRMLRNSSSRLPRREGRRGRDRAGRHRRRGGGRRGSGDAARPRGGGARCVERPAVNTGRRGLWSSGLRPASTVSSASRDETEAIVRAPCRRARSPGAGCFRDAVRPVRDLTRREGPKLALRRGGTPPPADPPNLVGCHPWRTRPDWAPSAATARNRTGKFFARPGAEAQSARRARHGSMRRRAGPQPAKPGRPWPGAMRERRSRRRRPRRERSSSTAGD
ncbi:MAG: hypothetical protein H0T75_11160 [Rhizobiales bacterium]|nr:hypothetical protein [Hyphomicrobiales bacterium]